MSENNSSSLQLKAGLYLCELIRCALIEDLYPGDLPDGVSLRQVYTIAKHNCVEGISYYGVTKGSFPENEELLSKWEKSLNKTILRQVYFDAERESIFSEMKNAGLSYLPLKGIKLVSLYPKPGMRSMADNDILYGIVKKSENGELEAERISEAQERMTKIMLQRGFEAENFTEKHDIFHKKPFYNFEMHKLLSSPGDPYYDYFANPWKRAVHLGEYEYTFSPEDDFIFNLAHMHKHYTTAGCGIRHIIDIYITQARLGDTLDQSYITAELKALGILDFYEKMISFMNDMFSPKGIFKKENEELLLFLTGCGTFGNRNGVFVNSFENSKNETKSSGITPKLHYIKKRIFPSKEKIKKEYPKFYGKPYLYPVLIFYRLGRAVFVNSTNIKKELTLLIKKK